MSVLTLNVNEVMRTLSAESSSPFVAHDKEVDIVRFAINSGFADIVLDGQVALRVMYQRPRETEVRAQTLTYYDTDGLHNYYDWQLSQSDLAKNGSLMVALCILDISGGEVSEWHTTPCAVRVLDTIHTDDSDEGDAEVTPTVKERVAVLESMIQRVASGAPIVVASTSAMTDTDQIYVLSTNGRWYYHNGTTWVAGGEYGAVATDTTLTQSGIPADAKKVGDEISAIKADLGAEISNVSEGYAYLPIIHNEYVKTDGDFAPYNGWFRTPKIAIPDNAKWLLIYIPVNTQYSAWYDSNGSFISQLNLVGGAGWKRIQIPTGAKYFAISNDKQYVGKYLYCGNEKTTELFNFLLSDFVINATQYVTMNSKGKPTGILHKRDGTTIREDTIEYSGNTITEYRTDSATGIYVTITTNLTTLETTVN